MYIYIYIYNCHVIFKTETVVCGLMMCDDIAGGKWTKCNWSKKKAKYHNSTGSKLKKNAQQNSKTNVQPNFPSLHIPLVRIHLGAFQSRGVCRGKAREAMWSNALWLLAVNSPPSPLGWPLQWTYELCHSAWRWETVQSLLIKYYSPLNG